MTTDELKKSISDLEARFKKITSTVQTERAKAEVYTATLKQLAPKRQATEATIKDKFNCSVDELPDVIDQEYQAVKVKTEQLEKRLRALEPEADED